MRRPISLILLALLAMLTAIGCSQMHTLNEGGAMDGTPSAAGESGPTMPMAGGMMSDAMRTAHRAVIPTAYQGLRSNVASDDASLERGATLYTTYCAVCHGDGGMGDGPGASALNPPASPIAHTGQMMGDAYLFWRISEGGQGDPVTSSMPPWNAVLDETARWDLINYIRALGAGTAPVMPRLGGAAFDPAQERARRQSMLATAVEQGVLTQEEAELFDAIHSAIDVLPMGTGRGSGMGRGQGTGPGAGAGAGADAMQQMLQELVQAGTLSADQAAEFERLHDRLSEAGLMP